MHIVYKNISEKLGKGCRINGKRSVGKAVLFQKKQGSRQKRLNTATAYPLILTASGKTCIA
jgi:hypothetical protein